MTLYELAAYLSQQLTPQTDIFENFMLFTTTDYGQFLRSSFSANPECVADRELGSIRYIVVGLDAPLENEIDFFISEHGAYSRMLNIYFGSDTRNIQNAIEICKALGFREIYTYILRKKRVSRKRP